MIRSLIIILEIVILVVVLRSPFVQYFLADIQNSVSDWLTEVSMVAEKHELETFRDSFYPHLIDVRDYQLEYIDSITSDKARLEQFHRQYCIGGDKNPFVYGANLNLICTAINRANLLKT